MFYLSQNDLKNTMFVAKKTNKVDDITAKVSNKDREFSIKVTFHPAKDIEKDLFPYWLVEMSEEEFCQKVYFGEKDLKGIKELYNGFINQKQESFLNTYVPY